MLVSKGHCGETICDSPVEVQQHIDRMKSSIGMKKLVGEKDFFKIYF